MKVILLRDVPKIGRQYEVKDVADGYAANFLLPRKLAEVATKGKVAELQSKRATQKASKEKHDSELLEKLGDFKESGITIFAPANEQGHLFKGVQVADVMEALENQGVLVEKEQVLLEHPIKEVGEQKVSIAVGGKEIEILVKVEAEK